MMTENLLVRVKRIVSGNIHDVVDRMEKSQAEIVMKEALREIDRAIEDVRSEQGRSMVKSKQAENQIEMLNKKIVELVEKTQFAIDQDRDDLAKAAIARQVDFEAQIPVLTSAHADAVSEQEKLAECVAALSGRKREMADEIKLLAQARSSVQEQGFKTDAGKVTPMQRADNATSAFQRAAESVSLVSGGDSENAAKLAELEKLSFSQKIEERLKEAKQLKKTA
jgi:phage shock protein A